MDVQSMVAGKPKPRSWMTPENSSVYFDRKLAYVVFRLSLGINILIHGSSRIFGPGVEAFASKTASEFAGTPLPPGPVHAFLTVLPFAEFILGVLITAGLFTRWALTLGGPVDYRSHLWNCPSQ
jgi:hypothetical protein